MSKTGQLWLETYENIFAEFYAGLLQPEQVVERLRRLGLTEFDIDEHLEVLCADQAPIEAARIPSL